MAESVSERPGQDGGTGEGGPPSRVVYRRAGPFASRHIAGETILVPIRGDVAQLESIFTLNPAAAAVWDSLSRPADEEALVARVLADFEVDEPTARADIRSFLETLLEEGLLAGDVGKA